MYDFITPEKILDALRWLNLHHPQHANVTVNDKINSQKNPKNKTLTCMLVLLKVLYILNQVLVVLHHLQLL